MAGEGAEAGRWEALFRDLEAQFEAAEAAELVAEVADRTRREIALVRLGDRLRAAVGADLTMSLSGGEVLRGTLVTAGPDWVLLGAGAGPGGTPDARDTVVVLAAVQSVTGLGARFLPPQAEGRIAARLDVRHALRALARARVAVRVLLRDGAVVVGTLDRIGADHLDLAEHDPGEARRPGAVRRVRTVPLAALSAVRATR